MRFFDPTTAASSARHIRIYAAYEVAFTAVDFAAAFLFIAGSALFFSDATTTAATWMFLIGSICFAMKPTIRLAREIHFWRIGDVNRLAKRAGG